MQTGSSSLEMACLVLGGEKLEDIEYSLTTSHFECVGEYPAVHSEVMGVGESPLPRALFGAFVSEGTVCGPAF